jgi:hypothetical protein
MDDVVVLLENVELAKLVISPGDWVSLLVELQVLGEIRQVACAPFKFV